MNNKTDMGVYNTSAVKNVNEAIKQAAIEKDEYTRCINNLAAPRYSHNYHDNIFGTPSLVSKKE